jgi:hypothetical protein
MNRKYIQILLAVLLVVIISGWQIYNRKKNIQQSEIEPVSYVPVEVTIERVFPSGTGFRRSTIITVSYLYKDKKYIKTIRRGGYVEARYKKGDTLTLFLDSANPEELIDKNSSGS